MQDEAMQCNARQGTNERTFDQLAAVGGAGVDLQGHDVALGLVEELDWDADRGSHRVVWVCLIELWLGWLVGRCVGRSRWLKSGQTVDGSLGIDGGGGWEGGGREVWKWLQACRVARLRRRACNGMMQAGGGGPEPLGSSDCRIFRFRPSVALLSWPSSSLFLLLHTYSESPKIVRFSIAAIHSLLRIMRSIIFHTLDLYTNPVPR